MTLIVAGKKVVVRPGTMEGPVLVPPNDLQDDEIWHMTAWGELAQSFLILRGSMLRETFPRFMALAEQALPKIECEDYAELGRQVFRQLLKLDSDAFARGLSNLPQPHRDMQDLRGLNPNAWALFDGVLTAPMALSLDTPPAFRRLDAMARVFHALLDELGIKPACVVVFAVPAPKGGVKFLVGCNKPSTQKNIPLRLAEELFTMSWVTTNVDQDVILALEMGIDVLNFLPKEDCEPLRESRVQGDHKKVLTWLKEDLGIGDPKTLAERLEFVPAFVVGQPIHGDMAALIWLLTEEKSPLDPDHALKPLVCSSSKLKEGSAHPSWTLLKKGHSFEGPCYMGDSYLCCPYCAYVVSQYNLWAEKKKLLRIGARGYHTADQGGWRFVFKPEKVGFLAKRRMDRLTSFLEFLQPLCQAMKEDRQEHIKRQKEKEQQGEQEHIKRQKEKEQQGEQGEIGEIGKETGESGRGRKLKERQSEVLLRTYHEGVDTFGAPPTIGFGGKFRQTISLRPSRSRSPPPVRPTNVSDDNNDL